jgi:FkbM family methyltransferase
MAALQTAMRKLMRQVSVGTFRREIVEHQFIGSMIKVIIADPTAAKWYRDELPTASEMHFIRDYALKPGAHVFNIGAHQAVIASMLAQIVGSEGLVVALEPDPFSYNIALQNKALNQLDQIEVLHAAGADVSMMIEFGLAVGTSGQIAAKGDGLPTISVQAYSVDDLTERYGRPDVLYIDVEGFEEKVLSGARRTLESARPDCVIEVHIGLGLEKQGGSPAGILSFFPPEIYTIFIKHPDPKKRDQLVLLDEIGIENWNYHCNMVAVKRT